MAINIFPHNLSQIIDVCCLYIQDQNIDIENLIKIVQGPDFPTKCNINAKDIIHAYIYL